MALRTLQQAPGTTAPSTMSRALIILLAPAVWVLSIALAAARGAAAVASTVAALPLRLLIGALQLADALICEALALLQGRPRHKTQVCNYEQTISSLQQATKAHQRQLLLLQSELDGAKMERSKVQVRNMELCDKVQALQARLHSTEAALVAAEEAVTAGRARNNATAERNGARASVAYDGRGWYLHACVVLAALGVRWWLLHQTDPLQRKVMLVVIWPIAWVYGAMLFNCMPRSSTLRAGLACCCWALLGYVSHEVIALAVRERQLLTSA